MVSTQRLYVRVGRMLVPTVAAATCALAAHAVAYQTMRPRDGVHDYFGWYEPLVTLASLVALACVLATIAAAIVARSVGRSLPAPRALRAASSDRVVGRLGASTLLILVAQETLERSLAGGRFEVSAIAPSQWLALIAASAAITLLAALVLRLVVVAVRRLLGSGTPSLVSSPLRNRLALVDVVLVRPRPLAAGAALRAPPAPAR